MSHPEYENIGTPFARLVEECGELIQANENCRGGNMNTILKILLVEVAATVVGTAFWEAYKKYCKYCWKKFSN